MLTTRRVSREHGAPHRERAPRTRPAAVVGPPVAQRPPVPDDALAGQLALAVARRGGGDAGWLLQRWPAERATVHPMSVERLTGKPKERVVKFANLRRTNTDAANALLEDMDVTKVWGSLKSDITGTGDTHGVRLDRQNPTPTHANVQIQTNGTSITLATALIANGLGTARVGPLKHHVRAALKASLADGMQWEVYDR